MVSFEGALGENLQILLIFFSVNLSASSSSSSSSLFSGCFTISQPSGDHRAGLASSVPSMFEGDSNCSTVRKAKKELKHLRVLRMTVIYMIMLVLNLYECAKKNSGPLRSTVWTMEVAVITIVGPVYRRYKGVPHDFLVLLDKKVNHSYPILTSSRGNT
ncbi:hypothetical protein ACLB2K_042456 [Fragaria x ananassa]